MKTFQARLRACLEKGGMTEADLTRWLGRPQPTVRTWIEKGLTPWGGPQRQDAFRRLTILEQLIKHGFKIPPTLTRRERIALVERLSREHLNESVSSARSAN